MSFGIILCRYQQKVALFVAWFIGEENLFIYFFLTKSKKSTEIPKKLWIKYFNPSTTTNHRKKSLCVHALCWYFSHFQSRYKNKMLYLFHDIHWMTFMSWKKNWTFVANFLKTFIQKLIKKNCIEHTEKIKNSDGSVQINAAWLIMVKNILNF